MAPCHPQTLVCTSFGMAPCHTRMVPFWSQPGLEAEALLADRLNRIAENGDALVEPFQLFL